MIVPAGVPIAIGAVAVLSGAALTAAIVVPTPPPPYQVWFDQPTPFGSLPEGPNELLLHANFGNVVQFRIQVYDDDGLVQVLASDGDDIEESFGLQARVLTSDTIVWPDANPGSYILLPGALQGSWKDSTPIVVTVQPGGGIEPGLPSIPIPVPINLPTATPVATPTPSPTTPVPTSAPNAPAPEQPAPSQPIPPEQPLPPLPAPPAPLPPAAPAARILFATGFTDRSPSFAVVDITPPTTSITVQIQIRPNNTGPDWNSRSVEVYCTPALDSYGRYRCTTPPYPVSVTTSYQYGYARLIANNNGTVLSPAPQLSWTVQPQIG